MKKYFSIVLLCLLIASSNAHIGSPGVTFEGKAGAYPLMVLINPPDVIPGTATVDIYLQTNDVQSIQLKPVYWYSGNEGTPKADIATPVENEPGHYRGIIWLMSNGTSSIELELDGKMGKGKVVVPVMAVSTAKKKMDPSLGYGLAALGIFLLVLMVTIISASVSDGLVKPGESSNTLLRKRLIGASASLVILFLILWGGKSWWDGLSEDYNEYTYKPFTATSSLEKEGNNKKLVFKIDAVTLNNMRYTRRLSYIIPDHGKLMHMFLVRAGSMDVFAHLHPQRKDTLTFESKLPPIPPGQYLVFADITSRSGFAETIADTLNVPENNTPVTLVSSDSSFTDRDDTYLITNAIGSSSSSQLTKDVVVCGKIGAQTKLPDGSIAVWQEVKDGSLHVGKLYSLAFDVLDPEGKPAQLEPYLGMMGHAVVMKDDGSVYIHLHPVGNYSMVSQSTLEERFQKASGPIDWSNFKKPAAFADSINGVVSQLEQMPEEERNKLLMGNMTHSTDSTHEHTRIEFPYAFPSPGNYRIWIQMKRNGKILNSAFDASVVE